MNRHRPTLVQEIAEAAVAFQRQTTGHAPGSATVVLSHDTLVVLLHEALSPVERDLARSPSGAEQVREFHRQLFSTSCPGLREEIGKITGVEWREAAAEVEPTTGAMVQAFTRNAKVQMLHFAGAKPGSNRIGRESGHQ